MTIKITCSCGTRYGFEVEPKDGAMPAPVHCPNCQTDGTAEANAAIAQTEAESQPRLRVQTAPARVAAPGPPVLPVMTAQPKVAGHSIQKIQAEARQLRWAGWVAAAVFLLLLGLAGAWGWYAFIGSKPKMAWSVPLPENDFGWTAQFLPDGKILQASGSQVVLREPREGKELWHTDLSGGTNALPPQIAASGGQIWLCRSHEISCLTEASGAVKQTIPLTGQLLTLTASANGILAVTGASSTQRTATHIELPSGDVSTQTLELPVARQQEMPDQLPPNVQPTAGVLLAQAEEDHKFNRPLHAVSSELFSTGTNLVELRVTLTQPNVRWVQSIKPRGPSLLNGATSTATSTAAVAEEVFNDIKRSNTGGVKSIDESRYHILLRRWLEGKTTEWEGDINGLPVFFALSTVDLIAAGTNLVVFDKQNEKLFQASLAYPASARMGGEAPAVERAGVLYFFDQGVLTAFALPSGKVQWRLTSIGISRAQFDGDGALYLDSTAASPEEIQYSDQIKMESTPPLLLKVDAHSGKILWQTSKGGRHVALSGNFVYGVNQSQGGSAMALGLADALHTAAPESPTYHNIFRLDSNSGAVLWRLNPSPPPEEDSFYNNCILLHTVQGLEAWKFLTFD